jgi:hypothetical protein
MGVGMAAAKKEVWKCGEAECRGRVRAIAFEKTLKAEQCFGLKDT